MPVSREDGADIKDAQTPLSLGSGLHPTRALWRQRKNTSTPLPARSLGPPRHSWLGRSDPSFLEPAESPIFRAESCQLDYFDSDIKDFFGVRRQSSSSVVTILEKMEICDNSDVNDNNNEKDFKVKENEIHCEKNSSVIHDQLKKTINKNKRKSSNKINPKNKSPGVYKTGRKVGGLAGLKKVKSPKIKSPRTNKVNAPKEVQVTSTVSSKYVEKSKQTIKTAAPKKHSPSSSHGSQCSALKTSKRPKSPKLLTAARAAMKRDREERRKENEKQTEQQRNQYLEEKKRQEEMEFRKLRQQTTFKAKPIRKYVPLPEVKKRALTDPVSPKICKRRRVALASRSCDSHKTD